MIESSSNCDAVDCAEHFHTSDTIFVQDENPHARQLKPEEQQNSVSGLHTIEAGVVQERDSGSQVHPNNEEYKHADVRGFNRIVLNFTPS
jgi:hypothetical protein